MKEILIGTSNQHKAKEIEAILDGWTIVTPAAIGLDFDVEETGSTFEENAALKAVAYAKASGLITLADDSGLAVDALDGAPGIHSHRYAPQPDATDADRRQFLLKNLTGKPQPWTARFHCAVAIAFPDDDKILYSHGLCEGEIIPEERGTNGFGYDAIFFIPDLNQTMAEISDDEKNHISHRARALQAARTILAEAGII